MDRVAHLLFVVVNIHPLDRVLLVRVAVVVDALAATAREARTADADENLVLFEQGRLRGLLAKGPALTGVEVDLLVVREDSSTAIDSSGRCGAHLQDCHIGLGTEDLAHSTTCARCADRCRQVRSAVSVTADHLFTLTEDRYSSGEPFKILFRLSSQSPMTDYSKSLIYRMVCDDGRFYIGSTVLAIGTRFAQHRRAVTNGVNSKVYKHIRAIGGVDKVRIELVADNLGISTRDELLLIEDSHIREGMKDKRCLNRNQPRATEEERLEREKAQDAMWKKINRDIAKERCTGVASTKTVGDRVREYYKTHKKKRTSSKYVECPCGWLTTRSRMTAHLQTAEHAMDLQRWKVMKTILHSVGIC